MTPEDTQELASLQATLQRAAQVPAQWQRLPQ